MGVTRNKVDNSLVTGYGCQYFVINKTKMLDTHDHISTFRQPAKQQQWLTASGVWRLLHMVRLSIVTGTVD
jgi:hypothetical protein